MKGIKLKPIQLENLAKDSKQIEEELKQFIYNRIFTLNIRQPKLFYGSPEVRQLNYQNFNNNKFKA